MFKIFDQYRGLSKDIYILFIGRVVSALGTFIWPMMTLILSVKFGYDSSTIASILVVGSFVNVAASLLGGKLADKVGKKKIILLSNYLMVSCYFLNAFLPLGIHTIFLFYLSAFFGNLQNPASEALIADKSSSKDREKAYSLSYLGWNLGFILGPSIGGFLFKDYLWLAFLIDGATTLIGTILIHIYVQEKRHTDAEVELNIYETPMEKVSTFQVIKQNKVLWIYLAVMSLQGLMYMQTNFLLPLHLESLTPQYSEIFGLMYSLNGLVVIIFTPLMTLWLKKQSEINKFALGNFFLMFSFVLYAFFFGWTPIFFIAMIIFTLGEIAYTISNAAYFTRRIPASHRGRVSAGLSMFGHVLVSFAQLGFGVLLKVITYTQAWLIILSLGLIIFALIPLFKRKDRQAYGLLYEGVE